MSIENGQQPPKKETGLSYDSCNRLSSSLRVMGMGNGEKREIMAAVDSLADRTQLVLNAKFDNALLDWENPSTRVSAGPRPTKKPVLTTITEEDRNAMAAVHMLEIAGFDVSYDPVESDGTRKIRTRHTALFKSVGETLSNMSDRAGNIVENIPEGNRKKATAEVTDEIGATICERLRDDNSKRLRAEKIVASEKAKKQAVSKIEPVDMEVGVPVLVGANA